MNWQIEQGCPQCGAPVTLEETDRILSCPFCRTRLFLVPDGPFRYHIPPIPGDDGDLIYIPYHRLRGSSFTVTSDGVNQRFVDTNMIATDFPGFSPSLGLRPQVLKLRFDSPSVAGRFIPANRPVEQSLPDLDQKPNGIFYRRFIGETVSLIHAPLRLRGDTLYDGILGRKVSVLTMTNRERLRSLSTASPGQVFFIPTLCPHCGWDMEGERDSLILFCRNCGSAWSCLDRAFTRVDFAVMAPPFDAEEIGIYLPFWRMKPRFQGLELTSFADLIRIANLPKAITSAHAKEPLYFWSPAFKVNPSLFARWSRQMTVFRPIGDESDLFPQEPLHPVTLPLDEAVEGIVINLAQMISEKRKFYPFLKELRIELEQARLEFHPFVPQRNELLHAAMRVSLDRTALAFGIRM